MAEKKTSFEDALRKLEEISENLKSENISLEEAMKNVMKYWKKPARKSKL